MHRFLGFISTKTGFKPFCKTEEISEIQVREGTITSPFPFKIKSRQINRQMLKPIFKIEKILKHIRKNQKTSKDQYKQAMLFLFPYSGRQIHYGTKK